MGVDVKDLPPAYKAQALRKWAEQERKKKRLPLPCLADAGPGKPAKYHNKPTERVTASGAVLRFDSQKEARRYDELAALEQARAIRNLRMQVDFTLQEAYTVQGGFYIRKETQYRNYRRSRVRTGCVSRMADSGGGREEPRNQDKTVHYEAKNDERAF